MVYLAYVIFGLYVISLCYVALFCLMQFNLLYHFLKNPHNDVAAQNHGDEALPHITVQLPIFNEQYVVERLIDTVLSIDYPIHLLEVQVLDDSTDDTLVITRRKVQEYHSKGYDIVLLHRENREGYKAGALKAGMKTAKGEFVAIFDADFLPEQDFYYKTMPYFHDKNIGVVQTKWGHINQNYSLLTKMQAMQLNVHFTIEQKGRSNANYLLQFNGTAGIWRREAIEEAGGWEADTLTEDLDLSYRAQLKGWKIAYLPDVVSPAELPAEMSSLKSQQYRWMKGGAETARKMMPAIWKSNLNISKKVNATLHLLSSSVFVFVFAMGILSFPLMLLGDVIHVDWQKMGIFMVSLISLAIVYLVANSQKKLSVGNVIKYILKFTVLFPLFLSLSMGLSLHNSVAVIQGFRGKKSGFIRTPKFGSILKTNDLTKSKYFSSKISGIILLELVMALYFFVAIIVGLNLHNVIFLYFHILFFFGFAMTSYYNLKPQFSKV